MLGSMVDTCRNVKFHGSGTFFHKWEVQSCLGFISRAETAFRILAAFHLLKLGLKFEMRPKCGLGATDESEAVNQ